MLVPFTNTCFRAIHFRFVIAAFFCVLLQFSTNYIQAQLRLSLETKTNESCVSARDGSITVSATGGTEPYQYSIDGLSFSPVNQFNSLAPGLYTVRVKDATEAEATLNANIEQAIPIIISNIRKTNPSTCQGGDGSIRFTAAGGTGNLSYSLDGVDYFDSSVFQELSSGIYTLYVRDELGCTANDTTSLTDPASGIVINAEFTRPSCAGGSDATITASASGSSGPFQYALDRGDYQESGKFENLVGNRRYAVYVLDARGCTNTKIIDIPGADTLRAGTLTITSPTCGNRDGSISVTPAGGNPPFRYSINDVEYNSSNVIRGLGIGITRIYIIDSKDCKTDTVVRLIPVADFGLRLNLSQGIICHGGKDAEIEAIVGSGFQRPINYALNDTNYRSNNVFSSLAAGTYTVRARDARGCVDTKTLKVEDKLPVSMSLQAIDPLCGEPNRGRITVRAFGGSGRFTYSINNGTFQRDSNFTALRAGNYKIEVSDDAGCRAIDSVELILSGSFEIDLTAQMVTCYGAADGDIEVEATGGTPPYRYSIDGGKTFNTNPIISNLAPGIYTVRVVDRNGCTDEAQTVVGTPDSLILDATITQPTCGLSNGAISLQTVGGIGSKLYSIDGTNWLTQNTFTNLSGGKDTIWVKDANECTLMYAFELDSIAPMEILDSAKVDTRCGLPQGVLFVEVWGGTDPIRYSINGGASYQDTATFRNLLPGIYELIAEDAKGCRVAYTDTIKDESITIEISSVVASPDCPKGNQGAINITVRGGVRTFGYLWSNGSTEKDLSNLTAGTYTLTVTDGNGCTQTASIVVTDPETIQLSIQTKGTQNGLNGRITVSATGGTAPYSFSLNDGAFQTSGEFDSLTIGSYTIAVKDAKGCEVRSTIQLTTRANTQANSILRIYPNPSTGIVNIAALESVNLTEPLHITLYDALGRAAFHFTADSQAIRNGQLLDFSAYPKGVYTLSLRNSTLSVIEKIVLR